MCTQNLYTVEKEDRGKRKMVGVHSAVMPTKILYTYNKILKALKL